MRYILICFLALFNAFLSGCGEAGTSNGVKNSDEAVMQAFVQDKNAQELQLSINTTNKPILLSWNLLRGAAYYKLDIKDGDRLLRSVILSNSQSNYEESDIAKNNAYKYELSAYNELNILIAVSSKSAVLRAYTVFKSDEADF